MIYVVRCRISVDISRLDFNEWYSILTSNCDEMQEKTLKNYEYLDEQTKLKQQFSAEVAARVKLNWTMVIKLDIIHTCTYHIYNNNIFFIALISSNLLSSAT